MVMSIMKFKSNLHINTGKFLSVQINSTVKNTVATHVNYSNDSGYRNQN